MRSESHPRDQNRQNLPAERTQVVAIRSLSHRYADGRQALADISFEVCENECLAIVGPNGAGKTTLFLRLCGILPGPLGQANVMGLDPADPSERKELPKRVGIVFQNPDDQLFSPTVLEDVAFGPLNLGLSPEEVQERVRESLEIVGLSVAAGRTPFQLSGGEKRRAALAGVLAMQPKVLLLDEPTMFLDPRSRREFIHLIGQLPGTKLIATHDLDLVLDCCPRVILLDGGRLIIDGPTEDILSNAQLMDAHGLEVPYRLRS